MGDNERDRAADTEDAADETAMPHRPHPASEQVAALLEGFGDATFLERSYASSDTTYVMVTVQPTDWVAFAEAAKLGGFDTFIDLAAVDHYTDAPRFEVAVNLLDIATAQRIIVSTRLPYDDPTLPSLTGVFAGANFYEREAYDLIGIQFSGHPDLTRILLPDEWEGHPLRKDYDVGAIPVEFKAGSANL